MTHAKRNTVNSDLGFLRDELLDASLIIDSHELSKAHGQLSARIAGRDAMLMTPRRAPGLLTDPDEMIVIDFDGRLVDGMGPVPHEALLHGEIYRARPAVGAIVRTHARYSSVTSLMAAPVRAVHGFGALLGSDVPIFPQALPIVSADLAQQVVAALDDADAILLRGNGAVVLGRSVPEAAVKAILLEESCELTYLALAAGQPAASLTDDEVTAWRGIAHDPVEQAWEYARERLLFDEFDE
jgi:ribulose-5-phosphate 4-epimerase/fuculose-1-phosphate aldolase